MNGLKPAASRSAIRVVKNPLLHFGRHQGAATGVAGVVGGLGPAPAGVARSRGTATIHVHPPALDSGLPTLSRADTDGKSTWRQAGSGGDGLA